jgi:hypothetical protein
VRHHLEFGGASVPASRDDCLQRPARQQPRPTDYAAPACRDGRWDGLNDPTFWDCATNPSARVFKVADFHADDWNINCFLDGSFKLPPLILVEWTSQMRSGGNFYQKSSSLLSVAGDGVNVHIALFSLVVRP